MSDLAIPNAVELDDLGAVLARNGVLINKAKLLDELAELGLLKPRKWNSLPTWKGLETGYVRQRMVTEYGSRRKPKTFPATIVTPTGQAHLIDHFKKG